MLVLEPVVQVNLAYTQNGQRWGQTPYGRALHADADTAGSG